MATNFVKKWHTPTLVNLVFKMDCNIAISIPEY